MEKATPDSIAHAMNAVVVHDHSRDNGQPEAVQLYAHILFPSRHTVAPGSTFRFLKSARMNSIPEASRNANTPCAESASITSATMRNG